MSAALSPDYVAPAYAEPGAAVREIRTVTEALAWGEGWRRRALWLEIKFEAAERALIFAEAERLLAEIERDKAVARYWES